MEVIPVVDLRGGRCVRLTQGDYGRETVFSDEPVAMATRWAKLGATRLHVVDLDGAREGRPVNDSIVRDIIEAVGGAAADLPVQVAGGVRDLEAIDAWLASGADRVVLGTAAARDPELAAEACRRHGERIVVSIDARDGLVAIEGWRQSTSQRATDLLQELSELGVRRFVYTDIARDGALTSPNYDAIAEMVAATDAPVIAAGGVAEAAHLVRLAELGAEAAIVGMALYDGRLSLPDALAALR